MAVMLGAYQPPVPYVGGQGSEGWAKGTIAEGDQARRRVATFLFLVDIHRGSAVFGIVMCCRWSTPIQSQHEFETCGVRDGRALRLEVPYGPLHDLHATTWKARIRRHAEPRLDRCARPASRRPFHRGANQVTFHGVHPLDIRLGGTRREPECRKGNAAFKHS